MIEKNQTPIQDDSNSVPRIDRFLKYTDLFSCSRVFGWEMKMMMNMMMMASCTMELRYGAEGFPNKDTFRPNSLVMLGFAVIICSFPLIVNF